MSEALNHIEEAYRLLTGEAYRMDLVDGELQEAKAAENFCTIAEELERIDRAIGTAGQSMFANMAQEIRAAYVEIIAARNALRKP